MWWLCCAIAIASNKKILGANANLFSSLLASTSSSSLPRENGTTAAVVVEGAVARAVETAAVSGAGLEEDTSADRPTRHPSKISRSSRPWAGSEGRVLSRAPRCLDWCLPLNFARRWIIVSRLIGTNNVVFFQCVTRFCIPELIVGISL